MTFYGYYDQAETGAGLTGGMELARFAATLAFALALSGCGSKNEDATAAATSAIQQNDLSESASELQADPIAQSECNGFVDGTSRPNSLAGVALGDSLEKVRQQLRCGALVYELTEGGVTVNGGDYTLLYEAQAIRHVFGTNGNEHAEAKFVGTQGNEKLVEFKRIGEYNGNSPPSVESVIREIETKYKKARRLEVETPFNPSIRYGYGSTTDGSPLVGNSQIGNCHSRMGSQKNCAFTFYAMIFPDSKGNPGLVKRYEISIFNDAEYEAAKAKTVEQLRSAKKQSFDNEVKAAGNVRGL